MLARSLFNERDKGSRNLVIVIYDLYLLRKQNRQAKKIYTEFVILSCMFLAPRREYRSFTDIHITI